ncbi:MAG: CehA/McbA family metallohydrolase [Patescibacteria group bacterium]
MESARSPHFTPIPLHAVYNRRIDALGAGDCSQRVLDLRQHLLTGEQVLWGIPFELGRGDGGNDVLLPGEGGAALHLPAPLEAAHLVFLHAVDFKPGKPGPDGMYRPMHGSPRLGERAGEYVLAYEDGAECAVPLRRRFNISEFALAWGENSFECVPHLKPGSFRTNSEELARGRNPSRLWGYSQFRTSSPGENAPLLHWLYALPNPRPGRRIVSLRFMAEDAVLFVFGLTATHLATNPLRWEARGKLVVNLPQGLRPGDAEDRIDLDLGRVISVSPRLDYGDASWEEGYNNKRPVASQTEYIVEYTAHPDAHLHLGPGAGAAVPLRDLAAAGGRPDMVSAISPLPLADRPVTVRVVERGTGKPVPVKIHIHGRAGEYLPPVNRHRIPNPFWFEDYSVDYVHGEHYCTYIPGEARFRLPLGQVYVEVARGFEIRPVRRTVQNDERTEVLVIELERVLPWRQRGWVTADTHVHFLSPQSALLEGAAEGVNVVNLLASQWGEFFSNIGDFDGQTVIGAPGCGGDGEHLVRVGTENRQHILGHISLLGYEGKMILPLTTGGPDESALGDPVEATLTAWAKECRAKNGLAILPHFPEPRAEGAAALVLGEIDGVEMTSWGDLYGGISPYSLSDWYRYLNCGYHVPAVGGTDKMNAGTAVGTIRTYARLGDAPLTYEGWKQAVRQGRTFVTYGPLLEFRVNGMDMGAKLELPAGGGRLEVDWEVASVTVPVTSIELVVNGETREARAVDPALGHYAGSWSVPVAGSSWLALRVRGGYPGKQEMIAAHSSAVMAVVDRAPCFDHADASTILAQIEGVTAYLKTLGTRADARTYEQLLATLAGAHRAIHNRMHRDGIYHDHTAVDDHHRS